MAIEPARRAGRRPTEGGPAPRRTGRASAVARSERAAKAERRRRQRHFRRRRRDLLEDTGLALLVTIALVSVTAGLGVLALIEVPLAAALVTSVLAERARKNRRLRDRRSVESARRARR